MPRLGGLSGTRQGTSPLRDGSSPGGCGCGCGLSMVRPAVVVVTWHSLALTMRERKVAAERVEAPSLEGHPHWTYMDASPPSSEADTEHWTPTDRTPEDRTDFQWDPQYFCGDAHWAHARSAELNRWVCK